MKITLIGAGSMVFTRKLVGDILLLPEFADVEIALVDIDPQRLSSAELLVQAIAETLRVQPRVTAHQDLLEALPGTNYTISTIQIGGFPATQSDFEVPKRFGIEQTVADTLGIGGIFLALRTIPVLLAICHQMERFCPDALLLNYVNPMAMVTWAIAHATTVRVIGLCHSIPKTAKTLAEYMELPVDELVYRCAGINHLAFYLELTHNGKDVYPLLRLKSECEEIWQRDPVRFELFQRLGYFVSESSKHVAEYMPYFIRRTHPNLIKQFDIPLRYNIGRYYYLKGQRQELDKALRTQATQLVVYPSDESAALLIHSIETNTPRVIYGNVLNHGLINNLPQDCYVEVPCLVDAQGIHPEMIGDIPPQLAALLHSNISVQRLVVEALLTGKKEYVYHAAMFDPHTAAELSLSEIYELVDAMFEVHKEHLPALR